MVKLSLDNVRDMEAVKRIIEEQNLLSPLHIDKVGSRYHLENTSLSDDQMIDLLIENGMERIVGGV